MRRLHRRDDGELFKFLEITGCNDLSMLNTPSTIFGILQVFAIGFQDQAICLIPNCMRVYLEVAFRQLLDQVVKFFRALQKEAVRRRVMVGVK